MNRKTSKYLALALSIVCVCIMITLLPTSSVQGQGQIHLSGEITGGYEHSYPIELKVGEEIKGQIIIRKDPLNLAIGDSTGKVIYNFGSCSTNCAFQYAAEANEEYKIIIQNLDTYAIGTRGYNIYYSILPTTLAPGTGSGIKVTGDATKPSTTSSSISALWWILGIIAFFVIAATVVLGSRRSTRRRRTIIIEDDDSDDYRDDDDNEEVVIEKRPRKPPPSDRTRDLYFPKPLRDIHQKGLNDLGQRQREDLKKTLKRLRK